MPNEKKPLLRSAVALLAIAFAITACDSDSPDATSSAPAQESADTVYQVRGIIRKLKNEGRIAVIDHEEIPGYMEAMVMPFHAKDASVFSSVKPGDKVEFEYHVNETDAWVERVTVTEAAETEAPSLPDQPETSLVQPGDTFPDFAFTDQDGQPRRLADFRGKTVALTFVFTRCPSPEFCPKMMRQFSEATALLQGGPSDWHLLTVSFDPEHDTPAVLKAYGEAYHFDPTHWTLLAGDTATTEAIAKLVGLRYGKTETGSYEHNLRTVVIGPDGTVARVFTDESWTPTDLADAMSKR